MSQSGQFSLKRLDLTFKATRNAPGLNKLRGSWCGVDGQITESIASEPASPSNSDKSGQVRRGQAMAELLYIRPFMGDLNLNVPDLRHQAISQALIICNNAIRPGTFLRKRFAIEPLQ
ncbi:MAG: hypothetical protein JKP96_14225 [Oceanicaulis sp.]|nr:hypothetical protein [Oceanicaulis sp.]